NNGVAKGAVIYFVYPRDRAEIVLHPDQATTLDILVGDDRNAHRHILEPLSLLLCGHHYLLQLWPLCTSSGGRSSSFALRYANLLPRIRPLIPGADPHRPLVHEFVLEAGITQ